MPTPASPGSDPKDTESDTIRVTLGGERVVATDEATGKEGSGQTKWEALNDLAEALRYDESFGDRLSGRLADSGGDSVEDGATPGRADEPPVAPR